MMVWLVTYYEFFFPKVPALADTPIFNHTLL